MQLNKVREAAIKDLPFIQAIMNAAILDTTAIYEDALRDEAYVRRWWDNLQAERMPVLVYEEEGLCAGYGSYGIFRPKYGYRFCVEHSVYVHQDYRGKGIGQTLLQALIARAVKGGFHTMIAGIDAENKGSIHFHEKFGFEQVGYLKEVGFKFNRWLDLVFMQLTLPSSPSR